MQCWQEPVNGKEYIMVVPVAALCIINK